MKELIGKKIESVWIDFDSQHFIEFRTDSGAVIYEAIGDCCSESWFADITGVSALIGETVSLVEGIDLPEITDNRSRQEYDEQYGYKIVTTGGQSSIIYRNSSNGYYCGWHKTVNAVPGDINMTQITDDYGA